MKLFHTKNFYVNSCAGFCAVWHKWLLYCLCKVQTHLSDYLSDYLTYVHKLDKRVRRNVVFLAQTEYTLGYFSPKGGKISIILLTGDLSGQFCFSSLLICLHFFNILFFNNPFSD